MMVSDVGKDEILTIVIVPEMSGQCRGCHGLHFERVSQ